MNDFSLFYLDHSFANAAKPRTWYLWKVPEVMGAHQSSLR